MPGVTTASASGPAPQQQPSGAPPAAQQHSQQQQQQQRPPSPPLPPVSPILRPLAPLPASVAPAVPVPTFSGSSTRYTSTPTPAAVRFFAENRAYLTHAQQADQAASATDAPAPLPLDLATNPDALALRSAISVLQIQRARAVADMAVLARAKEAALEDPGAFVRDLDEGRMANPAPSAPTLFDVGAPLGDDSSSSSSDEDDEDDVTKLSADTKGKQPADPARRRQHPKKPKQPPWRTLPQRQDVVRCPPINWAQYAVVGESLDKLHNEQLVRPNLGAPATVGSGGVYEFKGEPASGAPAPRLVGVAAPYIPGRDRLEKKTRKPRAAG